MKLLFPVERAAEWVLEKYFDGIMAGVVELQSYFASCEELAKDLEHWLYKKRFR